MAESNSKSFLIKALGVLAPPIIGCLGAAIAFYFGVQHRLGVLDERVLLLRQGVERIDQDNAAFRAIGPDGFTHSHIRAGLHSTIRVETKDHIRRDELDRRFKELHRNNPQLKE